MSIVLLSDVHLDEAQTELIEALQALLERFSVDPPDALYLLGDIFDAWVGDDDPALWFDPVKTNLAKLSRKGCQLYFLHGNRDFLVGKAFCERIQARLITEPYVIDLYGTPTALLHGDSLCTQDADYQAFKTMVRDTAWQREFLAKSLSERKAIAAHLRAQSKYQTSNKPEDITDVYPGAVNNLFKTLNVNQIIHGHTHRPNHHQITPYQHRWVLGDWRTEPSLSISYLEATQTALTLHAGNRSWASPKHNLST